jgi:hypothetical protein
VGSSRGSIPGRAIHLHHDSSSHPALLRLRRVLRSRYIISTLLIITTVVGNEPPLAWGPPRPPRSPRKKDVRSRSQKTVGEEECLIVPLCGAPRLPRPASRARLCSSLTCSNRFVGTWRYLIYNHESMMHRVFVASKISLMAYSATPDVTLFQCPKAFAIRCRLVHLAQRDIHKRIAVNQMSVECFSVFQFDHLPKMCHTRADTTAGFFTMGLPCAAFKSANGSYASAISNTRPFAGRFDFPRRTMVAAELKLRLVSQTNRRAALSRVTVAPASGSQLVCGACSVHLLNVTVAPGAMSTTWPKLWLNKRRATYVDTRAFQYGYAFEAANLSKCLDAYSISTLLPSYLSTRHSSWFLPFLTV